MNRVPEILAAANANRIKAADERSFVTLSNQKQSVSHSVPPMAVRQIPLIDKRSERAVMASIQKTIDKEARTNATGGVVSSQKRQQLQNHLMRPTSSATSALPKVGTSAEGNCSSDEEGGANAHAYPRDDYRADHLLHLVAKEECLLRMGRRNIRSHSHSSATTAGHKHLKAATSTAHTSSAAITTSVRSKSSSSDSGGGVSRRETKKVLASDCLVPFSVLPQKNNPLAPVIADKVTRREIERVIHSQFTSNITMTISDTMLQPDFSVPSAAWSAAPGSGTIGSFGMSTTLQATRPIISNTKFFRAVNEDRKKRLLAAVEEDALIVATGGALSTPSSTGFSNSKTKNSGNLANKAKRARYLDDMDLSGDDSDQEKEDSAVLTLLGE